MIYWQGSVNSFLCFLYKFYHAKSPQFLGDFSLLCLDKGLSVYEKELSMLSKGIGNISNGIVAGKEHCAYFLWQSTVVEGLYGTVS